MSKQHLKKYIGFGVAGNFAHHLEQAGEASDFVDVKVDDEKAPKGIFPFYLPNSETFLGTYPLSSKNIVHPRTTDVNLQMEPEVALICQIIYEDKKVKDIVPNFFTAYNDCSIRKENAKKISEKKNWGEDTKGISSSIIAIDKFESGGVMDSFHIASFLKRDGKIYPYGEDVELTGYSYFHEKLTDWMLNQINTQLDVDPLEPLSEYLMECDNPKEAIVSIGATRYTEFGEHTFLKSGDICIIIVYNMQRYGTQDILEMVERSKYPSKNISVLKQKVL